MSTIDSQGMLKQILKAWTNGANPNEQLSAKNINLFGFSRENMALHKYTSTVFQLIIEKFVPIILYPWYSSYVHFAPSFSFQEFLEWKWWVCGFIMAIFGMLGLVGNLMSLAVLMRPKIRDTSFNQLLAVMCIVDSLFIACNIMSCLQALGVKNGNYIFTNFYVIYYYFFFLIMSI